MPQAKGHLLRGARWRNSTGLDASFKRKLVDAGHTVSSRTIRPARRIATRRVALEPRLVSEHAANSLGKSIMNKFSVYFELTSPDDVTKDDLAKVAELLLCGLTAPLVLD